ncbi:MAG TPA: PQQ-binding-like beta-propeller repeat protein [Candidatus Tyrphobacter sp.]
MRAGHFCVVLVAAIAVIGNGCSSHYASQDLGTTRLRDPNVRVFRADRRTSWRQFRLGGGLDVVVVNPNLPREFAWRFPTGDGGISSSPTVMGATVLVSANDHHLYAIDAATGRLRWRYHAENEVMSQPAYAHGLVFIGIGNSDNPVYDLPYFSVVGSGMNKLEAIDATTGIEAWWTGLVATGMPSQAIVGNALIAVDGAGTVLAIDSRSGAYRWHTHLPSAFAMSSVVDGGDRRMYVSGRFSSTVYALRDDNGSVIWEHTFDPRFGALGDAPLASSASALVGMYLEPLGLGKFGMVVADGSPSRQHIYALDKRTGRLLWDRELTSVTGNAPKFNESAIALVYGTHVYDGSAIAPVLTALDLASGRVEWQLRVHGPVKGGIAARDGVLYFGDLGGTLWAVSARTGRAIGNVSTDMQFNVGSPIIVNDTLIVGTHHGDVIAVPLSTIRNSQQVAGVTRMNVWQRFVRWVEQRVPHRDPHLEESYFK